MTINPKTTASTAAEQKTLAHRPAAQNKQPTIPPGSSSGTPRPAAPSNAQAGQGKRSTPVQPGQAKSGIEPKETVAPPPTLPNPLPEGYRLWAPVKFLNVRPKANKP